MLHHRSAQIVEFARLAFVCMDKDSLFALPSMQYRLRHPSHLRVQASTPKVGGPLYRGTNSEMRSKPDCQRAFRSVEVLDLRLFRLAFIRWFCAVVSTQIRIAQGKLTRRCFVVDAIMESVNVRDTETPTVVLGSGHGFTANADQVVDSSVCLFR